MTEIGWARGERLDSGYVYLISPAKPRRGWVKGNGVWPFKIGVSKSINGVSNRLKDLSSGNWLKLEIANISPEVSEPYNVEWCLHTRYFLHRIRGEWFDLSFDDFNDIRTLLVNEPNCHAGYSLADLGRNDDALFIREYWHGYHQMHTFS